MKRESRTPEGFVHMKSIEEMEEVNIYSSYWTEALIVFPVPSPVKTPRPEDLFLYKP